jgi:hypothetical protein
VIEPLKGWRKPAAKPVAGPTSGCAKAETGNRQTAPSATRCGYGDFFFIERLLFTRNNYLTI